MWIGQGPDAEGCEAAGQGDQRPLRYPHRGGHHSQDTHQETVLTDLILRYIYTDRREIR